MKPRLANVPTLRPGRRHDAQLLAFITLVILVVLLVQPAPAVGTTCGALILVAAEAYCRLARIRA